MARPKLGDSESVRLQMVITADEIAAIDDYRFRHRIESRSAAIRELCAKALADDEAERALSDAIERDPTFPTHGGLF